MDDIGSPPLKKTVGPTIITGKTNYWKFATVLFVFLFGGSLFLFISSKKEAPLLPREDAGVNTTGNESTKTLKISSATEMAGRVSLSLEEIGQYSKTGQTVRYKCFEEADKTDDVDFAAIKLSVLKEDKAVNKACIYGNKAIVASVKKAREIWNEPYGMQIHIYTRTDNDWYYGESLFTSTNQEMTNFKLIDWTTSNDIVYALFNGQMIGTRRFLVSVYRTKLELGLESPLLIETCEYAIAGGTSERGFVKCVSFSEKDKSSYIKQSDLP